MEVVIFFLIKINNLFYYVQRIFCNDSYFYCFMNIVLYLNIFLMVEKYVIYCIVDQQVVEKKQLNFLYMG